MSIKINNEEIPECFYRIIFDGLSHEFQSTPLEEKKKALEDLVKNNHSLKILALKMYEACQQANKDIKFSHIVFGLADLLEEIIRDDMKKEDE